MVYEIVDSTRPEVCIYSEPCWRLYTKVNMHMQDNLGRQFVYGKQMSMHQSPAGTRRHSDSEYFVLMLEILDGLVVDLGMLLEIL